MAPDFSQRSSAIEVMDDLTYAGEVMDQTLVELEIINKWLGGNEVTMNGLRALLSSKTEKNKRVGLKIADLGCGGGDMLKLVANYFKKKKLNAEFTGIDANPNILTFAQKNTQSFNEIKFQSQNILSESFRSKRYDIVFATLFFHHFTSPQLVEIFKSLKKQTAVGIVMNDLHRHWLAYYSIKLLTILFSKSSMVKNDAPISVLRGFSKNELKEILEEAGIENYTLKWKWAFRWQLVIHCD
ncbi:MAG TPA: methyltransferase domain-containing protein [Cyclobacteriaceae bacterium]|nr:methyltransferase domain-containing protein [Cyclobacteriaceae bacterium]